MGSTAPPSPVLLSSSLQSFNTSNHPIQPAHVRRSRVRTPSLSRKDIEEIIKKRDKKLLTSLELSFFGQIKSQEKALLIPWDMFVWTFILVVACAIEFLFLWVVWEPNVEILSFISCQHCHLNSTQLPENFHMPEVQQEIMRLSKYETVLAVLNFMWILTAAVLGPAISTAVEKHNLYMHWAHFLFLLIMVLGGFVYNFFWIGNASAPLFLLGLYTYVLGWFSAPLRYYKLICSCKAKRHTPQLQTVQDNVSPQGTHPSEQTDSTNDAKFSVSDGEEEKKGQSSTMKQRKLEGSPKRDDS
jgi:hypothetical protein